MADYVPVATSEMVLSKDQISTGATFDAVVSKPGSGMDMYKLTLKLRLRMQQSFEASGVVKDASKEEFYIQPWTGPEWFVFITGCQRQAILWNDRFWLKPPPEFTDYDLEIRGTNSIFRPYIACELDVDFF